MAKTATISARIDPDLKSQAEPLFSEFGISRTEAITLFYKYVVAHRDLPFPIRIPNAETLAALQDVRDGTGLVRHSTVDELKKALDES